MRKYKQDKCSFCEQVKVIAAKGLCRTCYSRKQKTGSLEYKKKGIHTLCKIENCNKPIVGQKMCELHYRRYIRHGHIEQTRPKDWGVRVKHPLYEIWRNLRRTYKVQCCKIWREDFWKFVKDVGERPSKKHLLKPIDESAELSKDNFYWHESKFDKLKSETEKEYYRRWARRDREMNPDKYRNQSLRKQFGIGLDEYNAMLEEQKGTCAICEKPEHVLNRKTGEPRNLAVDHCHDKNKIRGLLCTNCNKMIGHAQDSAELLSRAIKYIKKHTN